MTTMTATEQTFDTTVAAPDGILLTDGAAAKVKGFWKVKGRADLALRVSGAAGRLLWTALPAVFDERSFEGDIVKVSGEGRRHRQDECAVPMGATIDFVDTIEKQGSPSTIPTPAAHAPAATASTDRKTNGASSLPAGQGARVVALAHTHDHDSRSTTKRGASEVTRVCHASGTRLPGRGRRRGHPRAAPGSEPT